MRAALALLAVSLLALWPLGCGGARTRDATGSAPVPTGGASARSESYRDGDDSVPLTYGRPADAAETRAISTVVKLYYAAAAAANGARACALSAPGLVATIPEDYGQELGPGPTPQTTAYLRGARDCAALLTLVFEHTHGQLASPIQVTGVRVAGDYAYALIGSPTLPASFIEVAREAGAWRIDGLLGRPVP